MSKDYIKILGLLLAFEGEPAEGSPIELKAKHQVVYLVEVVQRAVISATKKEKWEQIYEVCKKINSIVTEAFPEEIEELKNEMIKEKEMEQEENGN